MSEVIREDYDLVIIGAGPAGLTAGIYAARSGMRVLLVEKTLPGGQMQLAETIENFPGFPEGIKGARLGDLFQRQAISAGARISITEVKEINVMRDARQRLYYLLKTEEQDFSASAIVLACGAAPRKLNVPGEEQLSGRGVSYCAVCDGPLFRGRSVAVVGGGNSACEEAIYLSKIADEVFIIHRRGSLRADKVLRDRLTGIPRIKILWNSRVTRILGEERLRAVEIEHVETGEKKELAVEGIFIYAGLKPNTDFLGGLVDVNEEGFVRADGDLRTSRPGIFAAGDCRERTLRQIITACGEGAQAAWAAYHYVERWKGITYV